ncbi:M20/M25/M40 family metallo-hydrolase [Candidatus Eisenbacteria bacterium]|uniref:M20/M25/M40 family metallo-hydrolase n=1 Tax=Eiseniibacteriota bacterium TaxID=2212470 RepID=A0ABV6YKP2_UNCEI
MDPFAGVDRYLEEHLDASLRELTGLCEIPSVGAQNTGLDECAAMVAELLRKRGFEAMLLPTDGAPVVFAERRGRSDKTLLFYNHYDVQPAEPLDLWESPPFEATLRGDKLYARGVSDDKGHFINRLFAIDALLDRDGELPCNIKFVVEGEEETGSPHLEGFVRKNTERLAADACVWEFGEVDFQGVPVQYLGLRGICYVELSVQTAKTDAHSGLGGTIFPNAAWRLVWALNTLKGPDERIRIPDYYENVIPPTERDIELATKIPSRANEYRSRYGIAGFLRGTQGGVELSLQEVFEPSCTICGLTAGYQGTGGKTVLPCKASAKVDLRLVPDQTPQEALSKLRSHLDAEGFDDVHIDFLGGIPPGRTDPDDPFVKLVVESAKEVYGVAMDVIPMVGGSGPNAIFLECLKLPVVTQGLGYPGTNAHAPNENVRLDLYLKCAKHMTRILSLFAMT